MNEEYMKMDLQQAMERLHFEEAFLLRLIKKLLDGDMLQKAEESFEKGDVAGAEISIHSIKGASANLGLVGLSKLALDIETKIKGNAYLDMEMLGWMKQIWTDLKEKQ